MRISTVGRHLREGSRSIWRNGWMSFASISAIAISLFILGVFLLLALNVNQWIKDLEKQVEIRVMLSLDIEPGSIAQMQNDIGNIPEVSKVTFVSKDEGLEILRNKLGKDGEELLEGLEGENNPLNDSFTVEVRVPQDVEAAAKQIKDLNIGKDPELIESVDYGHDTVKMLFKVTSMIQRIGIVLVVALALTAMFLIANTIKLTILARRREIGIMKLVGATNNFIRWPFFIEGALIGIIGSVIPVIVLTYGYWSIEQSARLKLGIMMIEIQPFHSIVPKVSFLLLAIGVVIGIWGSTLSVRKYLKV